MAELERKKLLELRDMRKFIEAKLATNPKGFCESLLRMIEQEGGEDEFMAFLYKDMVSACIAYWISKKDFGFSYSHLYEIAKTNMDSIVNFLPKIDFQGFLDFSLEVRPFVIFCKTKRYMQVKNMTPTEILIFQAQALGFEHLELEEHFFVPPENCEL